MNDNRIDAINAYDEPMRQKLRTKCQERFLAELSGQGDRVHVEPREGGYRISVHEPLSVRKLLKGAHGKPKHEFTVGVDRLILIDLDLLAQGKKNICTIGYRFVLDPSQELSYNDPLKWLFPIVRDEHNESMLKVLRWEKPANGTLFGKSIEEIGTTEKRAIATFHRYVKDNHDAIRFSSEDCYHREIKGVCAKDGVEVRIEAAWRLFLSLRRKTMGYSEALEIASKDIHSREFLELLKVRELLQPILRKMRDQVLIDQERAITELFA